MNGKTLLFAVGLAVSGIPCPASAVLGGSAESVQADVRQMNGALRTTPGNSFVMHEIRAASGTTVKEYVSPSGTVFGVSWAGPALPDLRQLLGSYFGVYTQAAEAQRAGHGPVSVQEPGFVLQSGGQMRALFGRAYVPSLIPSGVSADQIQ